MSKFTPSPNYKGSYRELDKERFRIVNTGNYERAIYYTPVSDDVAVLMWSTISNDLDDYSFYVIDETAYPFGFVTLMCVDDLGDLFHAGRWDTLEEAEAWLDNPKPTSTIKIWQFAN